MSRRPSEAEIDQVRDYIEYCIMHYKSKKETMEIIATQANIEHVFTQTIWEEMERQNPEFFEAYYIRMTLIDQIHKFNSALLWQAELMHRHHRLQQRASSCSSQLEQQRNGLHSCPNASQREPMHELPQHASGFQHVPQPMPLQQCPSATQTLMQHDGFHCSNASQLVDQHNGFYHCSSTTQQVLMNQHNGLQQGPFTTQHAPVHQHNELHSHSNASQWADQHNGLQQGPVPMHQDNGLHLHSNASHEAQLMHPHNKLQQRHNATLHAQHSMQQNIELHPHFSASHQEGSMHQHNGLHPHSNASRQVELMHQHNGLQQQHERLLHHSDDSQYTEPMHHPYLNYDSNVLTPEATELSYTDPQQDGRILKKIL